VADFGTAITIDLVTAAGEYQGGVIAPGLAMSLEALAERTALLPRVTLTAPRERLGRDTVSSILAGVVHGGVALCDGLIGELKRRYAPRAVVIATGGGSHFVVKHLRCRAHLRPTLVLDGLLYLDCI
jgi:type III pantothenate kinase